LSVERILNPAEGRNGGHAGAAGRIRIGENGSDIAGKGELRVNRGETLIFETPGGGGFGDPNERDPEKVAFDLSAGVISDAAARTAYGKRT